MPICGRLREVFPSSMTTSSAIACSPEGGISTGFSNSAATSRKMWTDSASSWSTWERRLFGGDMSCVTMAR